MVQFFKSLGNKFVLMIKRFTWFELLYMAVGLIIVTVLSILLKSSAITIIYSIFGILNVGFLTEQFKIAMVFGVIQNGFYIVQSIIYKNWGEVISNATLVFPILIVALISWFAGRDKNSDTVKSNKIKAKEWICIVASWLVIAVSFYFILDALNTSYVIVACILCAFTAIANYLLFRKSQFSFLFFIINNVIMFVLWLLPIVENGNGANLETIPMFITILIYSISNIVSLINWSKEAKQQRIEEENKKEIISNENEEAVDKKEKLQ